MKWVERGETPSAHKIYLHAHACVDINKENKYKTLYIMKNLNYLSKIRGYFSASQSNDVSFDCRLTVVRPL